MGCSNIWARFNWTEKNQKVVELNNNLDEEKIEKKIKDFYKILLNREPDIEGLNYYTKLVQKNSLTMDEVYNKIQNSSEVNKLKNTKIDNNRVIFKSKYTAEEIKKVYEKLGFVCYDIIDDAMPSNKCIPSNIKRNKLDRIMVMSVEK